MAAVIEFDTRDELIRATARRIAETLDGGIAARGAACAALSGGATPEPAYAALAALPLDWPKIAFALVDERFVPPDHPASNEAMLRRTLAPALARGADLLPMYGPGSVEAAADRADTVYAPLYLDIAVMGMGEDGHTASWFSGAANLERALDPCSGRSVVALHAPQAAGAADRLSLTRAAITRAGEVVLVIAGAAKRTRLEQALHETPEQAPVAALFDGRVLTTVLWAP
jgi:6-phosphogluconolactonase